MRSEYVSEQYSIDENILKECLKHNFKTKRRYPLITTDDHEYRYSFDDEFMKTASKNQILIDKTRFSGSWENRFIDKVADILDSLCNESYALFNGIETGFVLVMFESEEDLLQFQMKYS